MEAAPCDISLGNWWSHAKSRVLLFMKCARIFLKCTLIVVCGQTKYTKAWQFWHSAGVPRGEYGTRAKLSEPQDQLSCLPRLVRLASTGRPFISPLNEFPFWAICKFTAPILQSRPTDLAVRAWMRQTLPHLRTRFLLTLS